MQQDKGHIIGRQKVSVRYRGQADGISLQKKVNEVCHHDLPSELEKILDRFAGGDTVIRIDQLKITAQLTKTEHLREDLLKIISEKVEQALQQAIRDHEDATKKTPAAGNFTELLCFYLQHGYLPWWSPVYKSGEWAAALNTFRDTIITGSKIQPAIIHVLQQPAARERFASMLTTDQLINVVNTLRPGISTDIKRLQAEVMALTELFSFHKSIPERTISPIMRLWKSTVLSVLVKQEQIAITDLAYRFMAAIIRLPALSSGTILTILSHEQTGIPLLEKVIREQLPFHTEPAPSSTTPMPEQTPLPEPQKDESIYTGTAGLVLTASYLQALFKTFNLVTGKEINDPARAVAILHYIATGKDTFEEFEAVMEKTLCGIPLSAPVVAVYHLTDEEKAEVQELLTAVISHWTALKNTSPQGLQVNFLQREGRLSQNDHQWLLSVKREAHDILLDFIPWNFRMIMTPWMDRLMIVNWH